jgi:hypothetical protein
VGGRRAAFGAGHDRSGSRRGHRRRHQTINSRARDRAPHPFGDREATQNRFGSWAAVRSRRAVG